MRRPARYAAPRHHQRRENRSLRKLLYLKGILTQEEYESAKRRLLAKA